MYAQVARRVFKVRVMVLEYAPRILGTRHGLRDSRVHAAVLGYTSLF